MFKKIREITAKNLFTLKVEGVLNEIQKNKRGFNDYDYIVVKEKKIENDGVALKNNKGDEVKVKLTYFNKKDRDNTFKINIGNNDLTIKDVKNLKMNDLAKDLINNVIPNLLEEIKKEVISIEKQKKLDNELSNLRREIFSVVDKLDEKTGASHTHKIYEKTGDPRMWDDEFKGNLVEVMIVEHNGINIKEIKDKTVLKEILKEKEKEFSNLTKKESQIELNM